MYVALRAWHEREDKLAFRLLFHRLHHPAEEIAVKRGSLHGQSVVAAEIRQAANRYSIHVLKYG